MKGVQKFKLTYLRHERTKCAQLLCCMYIETESSCLDVEKGQFIQVQNFIGATFAN
ncbi:hypothetical protein BRADI_3g30153v3 [Brachypodium distachyon]|uniref:Uncharacterized protein n=1 Tax=Brachypodium distachyon TaxID=15368 RepID=A0A2K2D043_BRADI|nr:hypothetical protein BRADI_3g30153v3 [Brachypodium distachyon]